jgi:CubicO group peptidase (beta-lactamase class C family)
MLRRGRWGDRQLVPEDWVSESTRLVTPSRDMNPPSVRYGGLGYGYLWWILEAEAGSPLEGAYSARGAYGQYLLVVPRLDLVIAHKRVPDPNQFVSWPQFMGAVDRLIAARCRRVC